MTERPGQDTATDDLPESGDTAAGTDGMDEPTRRVIEPGTAAARAAGRPSPTSRARRTAATAAGGLRRPSPGPGPATGLTTPPVPGAATSPAEALAATRDSTDSAADGTDSLDARPADLVSRRPSAAEAGRRLPALLAAVLVVGLLALAGLDGWLLTSQPGSGSRAERERALSTAKSAVPLILSYDYQHFDSDVATAKARLTGRAVNDYAQAMAKTIKPTATKVHAVVQAQTDGAGVEAVSGNGNQVTVVVFGEQKVTNISLTAPRIDLFRVRVTLDRVQGQWLVSKFDQI
jgi:Mce-associated membrane protein